MSFNCLCHLACFTFSKLYFPHHTMEIKPTVLVFYCCITNHPKAKWLKTTAYYFSQLRISGGSSAGFTWSHAASFCWRVSYARRSEMASFIRPIVGANCWLRHLSSACGLSLWKARPAASRASYGQCPRELRLQPQDFLSPRLWGLHGSNSWSKQA